MGEHESGERHERDSLSADLDAMRKIANALDSLRSDSARQRVLQWAQARYHATVVPPAPVPDVTEKPPAGVRSMIKGFAADLRRFALEWSRA
jgi:predicted RNase H-like nuclease (RuvC/YqgF family)